MPNNIFNMVGGGFQHAFSSCGWEHPKYVIWDKEHKSNISVHIDSAIFDIPVDSSKLNIAWFCESPYFMHSYTKLFDHQEIKEKALNDYKFIFSSDKEFLKKHPEFKYVPPHARSWVEQKNIFPKSKLISIIASFKNEAPGHQLRHMVIDTYKEILSIFGSGYNPIKSKNEGLNDFMFSFAIENIKTNGYFTEKISDCFATGTIPIYWGDETISDYFEEDGIIRLNDNFDPTSLTPELYESKMNHIQQNFNSVNNLLIPEDYIYTNYLKI